jgi:hypothetical protein
MLRAVFPFFVELSHIFMLKQLAHLNDIESESPNVVVRITCDAQLPSWTWELFA